VHKLDFILRKHRIILGFILKYPIFYEKEEIKEKDEYRETVVLRGYVITYTRVEG